MSLSSNLQDDTDLADSVGKVSLAPILDLAKFAINRGMDQESVEGLIGIPLQCADPRSRISSLAGPILFNQILIKGFSNAPALELSQSAPIGVLGGVEKLVLLAPNGHEALRSLASNFAAFLDSIDTELEETKSYVKFSFSSNADEYDNGGCSEAVLTLLVRLMRFTFGANGQPHEVQFRYDRNGVASAYEDYFKAPVKFWSQEDRFSIVFKKNNLEHPQLGYDPELFRLAIDRVSKAAELNIDSSPAVEYFQLVTASNYCVRAGIFSVAAVAAKAKFGERTAQRVAHRHGSSIGKLIDQARLRMLRKQLARNPQTSAEDLSAMIGFSESRALRRAIKTWTGQSLSKFRAEHTGYNKLPI